MTIKTALIASTALALTAGVAVADVTISGYGRTGVQYYSADGDENNSQIISRMRLNFDASTTTDNDVEFGGRIRMQWDQGETGATESPAYLYVTSNGLTVSVGNVNTAFDSAGLLYEMELGAYDVAVGEEYQGGYFSFSTDGYDNGNRVGVAAEYELDSLTVRASYVDPDQSGLNESTHEEEFGISADYVWNEKLELSAAYVNSGNGEFGNDQWFLGARYAVLDNARIGLNYYSTDEENDAGDTVYLYGDYTLADGNTNIEAYIANNNNDDLDKKSDNAFGIGVNYDLGGARLGASIQRDYFDETYADMGVRFDF